MIKNILIKFMQLSLFVNNPSLLEISYIYEHYAPQDNFYYHLPNVEPATFMPEKISNKSRLFKFVSSLKFFILIAS